VTAAGPKANPSASGSVRAVLTNPGLRRIVGGWSAGIAGDNALLVAILIIAFQQGGPLAVGIYGVVRIAPSIVIGPAVVGLASRYPPTRLLFTVQLIRTIAAIAAVGVILIGGGLPALFVVNAIGVTAGALVRPLQSAALPSLARTPAELVAANVALSTGEGLGGFGGPLLAGILVTVSGPPAAAVSGTVLFGLATLFMATLGASADDEAEAAAERRAREALADSRASGGPLGNLTAGLRIVRHRPGAAAILFSLGSQVVTRGLMNALITVAAFNLLGLGEPGVGTLNAAWGLGGLLGAVAAVSLATRKKLGPSFALSLVLWGFPLAVIGAVPLPVVAFAAMFVSGAGNATLDISGFTLLQRTVPSADRMAVFVLLEAIAGIGLSIGSILAPVLLAALGDRGALAVAGAILPIVAVATWGRIHRVDEEAVVPSEQVAILRSAPMFERLPMTALERLAEGMRSATFEPETDIVREGEKGDTYLIVDTGRVEVSQAGRPIAELGPGEAFGEIALLHGVPRTATVRAIAPSTIYTITCRDFNEAIAGPTSAAIANRVAADHLARGAEA
jgi:Cyclic nucleotide-binding domain/Major Facilitator Superfamily